MSYSVNLEIFTGIEEREVVDIGNVTFNLKPMFKKAKVDLPELHGKECFEVTGKLRLAIKTMEMFPDRFRKLNLKNGWGNYDQALKFLKKLYRECSENPRCKIYVC